MANYRPLGLSYFEDFDQLKETVIEINKEIVSRTYEPFMILDEGRLDSAIGQVFQSWYTEEQALAALYKSLIINHAFANANKRVAYITLTGIKNVELNPNELKNLTYTIAKPGGSQIEINEISNVLFGTDYDVEHERLEKFLDYDDEDDDEDDEEDLTESTHPLNKSALNDPYCLGEIRISSRILLELYGSFFDQGYMYFSSEETGIPEYNNILYLYATLNVRNPYPDMWDLHIVEKSLKDTLWDSIPYYTAKRYARTYQDVEHITELGRYTKEELEDLRELIGQEDPEDF